MVEEHTLAVTTPGLRKRASTMPAAEGDVESEPEPDNPFYDQKTKPNLTTSLRQQM